MAEATVETPPSRFFCHECNREVQPNIPAYTCSRCNSGFIEEMERPAPQPQPDPAHHFAEMLQSAFLDPLRSAATPGPLSWQLGPVGAGGGSTRHRYNTRQQAAARGGARGGGVEFSVMEEDDIRGIAPSAMFHIHTGEPGQPHDQTFHGFLNYVFQRLGTNAGSPVILRGNPGDYAWGPGGLDTIITQLLNLQEYRGAPPAQKEKIENLPRVIIDQSHVDATLQCSICMDDFELGMEVRKLPCGHMYHSDCIVKWLEMHGTCPVCRKNLNGEDTSTTDDGEFSSFFPPPSGDGASSSSSNSSLGPSSSSSTSYTM